MISLERKRGGELLAVLGDVLELGEDVAIELVPLLHAVQASGCYLASPSGDASESWSESRRQAESEAGSCRGLWSASRSWSRSWSQLESWSCSRAWTRAGALWFESETEL